VENKVSMTDEVKNKIKLAVNIVTVIALMALCAATIGVIVYLWPSDTLCKGCRAVDINIEQRFIILVALGGALGAFIHISTSFVVFLGNGKLVYRWMPWYFMRPFIGSAIALVFYLLLRGGIISYQPTNNPDAGKAIRDTTQLATANTRTDTLSSSAGKDSTATTATLNKPDTTKNSGSFSKSRTTAIADPGIQPEKPLPFNPFGIMAVACLAGMFSRRATLKLEDAFKGMFPTEDDKGDGSPLLNDKSV
jgi:hypothetical protein